MRQSGAFASSLQRVRYVSRSGCCRQKVQAGYRQESRSGCQEESCQESRRKEETVSREDVLNAEHRV